jgi:hypothetical protein
VSLEVPITEGVHISGDIGERKEKRHYFEGNLLQTGLQNVVVRIAGFKE